MSSPCLRCLIGPFRPKAGDKQHKNTGVSTRASERGIWHANAAARASECGSGEKTWPSERAWHPARKCGSTGKQMRLRRADMAGERGNADKRTWLRWASVAKLARAYMAPASEHGGVRERSAPATCPVELDGAGEHTLRPTGQRTERTWWASARDAGKSRGSQRAWRASAHGSRRA